MIKSILKIHLEILDNNRKKLLEKLPLFIENFVLGGGTALSLQINHRISYDFDFFTSSPIPRQLLEELSKEIEIGNIVIDTSSELTFLTKNDIKVTFLHYPFKTGLEPIVSENGLKLFSVGEIAIQKAYAIGRRGEYRDYFDLYTILKNNYISFDTLISETKKVFGSVFDEKIFLEQLVYFGDLRSFEIASVIGKKAPLEGEVRQYFKALVSSYMK
ncbi:MAG: nucleotidyl transferase AbiEii/AbiGii toxin family protein [bacterium]|nr:nucleotidyl transferase AbiEii/AbiGii toxin family protein [bacterium]